MEVVENLPETIKMKNADITHPMFISSWMKIVRSDTRPKLAWRINYISEHLDRHKRQLGEAQNKLIQKYAKKDDDGKLIPATNPETEAPIPNSFSFKDEESGKLYGEEIKELEDIEWEIPRRPLDVNELDVSGIRLAPADISVLSKLLCGDEEE